MTISQIIQFGLAFIALVKDVKSEALVTQLEADLADGKTVALHALALIDKVKADPAIMSDIEKILALSTPKA